MVAFARPQSSNWINLFQLLTSGVKDYLNRVTFRNFYLLPPSSRCLLSAKYNYKLSFVGQNLINTSFIFRKLFVVVVFYFSEETTLFQQTNESKSIRGSLAQYLFLFIQLYLDGWEPLISFTLTFVEATMYTSLSFIDKVMHQLSGSEKDCKKN